MDLITRLKDGTDVGAVPELEKKDLDDPIVRAALADDVNALIHHGIQCEHEATAFGMFKELDHDHPPDQAPDPQL